MPEGVDLHEVLGGDAQAWANAGAAIVIGFITIMGWMRTKRINSTLSATLTASDVYKQLSELKTTTGNVGERVDKILVGIHAIVKMLEQRGHEEELSRAYQRGRDEREEERRSRGFQTRGQLHIAPPLDPEDDG